MNPAILNGSQRAKGFVNYAVKKGWLMKPTELACVDCGKPAQHWEHRDYNDVYDVEPVCQRCNCIRGKGKPKEWSILDVRFFVRSRWVLNISKESMERLPPLMQEIAIKAADIQRERRWPTVPDEMLRRSKQRRRAC